MRRNGGLERRDALGLRALLALRDLEGDALVLVEAAVAAGGDRRVVDEHVRAAAVGRDESEALLGVEPLHGAFRHFFPFGWYVPDRPEADRPSSGLISRPPVTRGKRSVLPGARPAGPCTVVQRSRTYPMPGPLTHRHAQTRSDLPVTRSLPGPSAGKGAFGRKRTNPGAARTTA